MDAVEFKTELSNRVIHGDGDSVVSLEFLYDHLLDGKKASQVFVSKEDLDSDEVTNYNKRFYNDQISQKVETNPISTEWIIPESYATIDLSNCIIELLKKEIELMDFSDEDIKTRYYRTRMEYRIWKQRNLLDMLRTLIYVVNTFNENNIIWGTGRGSSCASYILYLIGLHQVDSVAYDLDIGDFFR